MTAHASRNGLKRLDADDGRRPPDPPSFDDLIEAHVAAAVQPLEERLDGIKDELVADLLTDPTAFVKLWPCVLTIANCAEIYQMHRNTMMGFARLPEAHPDHLPCVDERPYRILPSDFANWITRRRNR